MLGEVASLAEKLDSGIAGLEKALGHESSNVEAEEAPQGRGPAADAQPGSAADSLETLVADGLWPLPTYQEMLFIR